MKAAVFHGPGDVRFEEVATPEAGSGKVLLRVRACGICGSDLHTYRHGLFPDLGRLVDEGRILGHEFSGEIVDMQGELPGFSVGDRVITTGMGGNAEYISISESMSQLMIPFDESVSFVEAATTEPLATSLHAANLGAAEDGETHVIMGAGIIGLGILQCIKARSAARVIVVDLSDRRLDMAGQLGADVVVNAANEDAVQNILDLTGSEPLGLVDAVQGNVDTVYDCAGMTRSFAGTPVLAQALSMVRQNGRVVVVAVFEKDVSLDYNVIVRKGIQVLGSWAWTMDEFVEAADLIKSRRIDRGPLVTHVFPLEQASEAYETQLRAEEAVKVVFTP